MWFEDLRTIPKLYTLAENVVAVDKKWYLYLMRNGSITHNKNTARNLEIIDAVNEILNFYKDTGNFEKYSSQLEYMAYYNQYLTSCTRVNLSDWKSEVQAKLVKDFCDKFPDYKENPYCKTMPAKYKLLDKFISRQQWLNLHIVMRLNDFTKKKNI